MVIMVAGTTRDQVHVHSKLIDTATTVVVVVRIIHTTRTYIRRKLQCCCLLVVRISSLYAHMNTHTPNVILTIIKIYISHKNYVHPFFVLANIIFFG